MAPTAASSTSASRRRSRSDGSAAGAQMRDTARTARGRFHRPRGRALCRTARAGRAASVRTRLRLGRRVCRLRVHRAGVLQHGGGASTPRTHDGRGVSGVGGAPALGADSPGLASRTPRRRTPLSCPAFDRACADGRTDLGLVRGLLVRLSLRLALPGSARCRIDERRGACNAACRRDSDAPRKGATLDGCPRPRRPARLARAAGAGSRRPRRRRACRGRRRGRHRQCTGDRRAIDGERRQQLRAHRRTVLHACRRDHEPGRAHAENLPAGACAGRLDSGRARPGERRGQHVLLRHDGIGDFRRRGARDDGDQGDARGRLRAQVLCRHHRRIRADRSDHPAERADGDLRRRRRRLDRFAVSCRTGSGPADGDFVDDHRGHLCAAWLLPPRAQADIDRIARGLPRRATEPADPTVRRRAASTPACSRPRRRPSPPARMRSRWPLSIAS